MIGIDEVGRGAWAGPLLVVAVRLKPGRKLPKHLQDSKILSKKKREKFFVDIVDSCDIGEGWVSASMIDELGLARSLKSAILLSVLHINGSHNEEIILDGSINYFKGTGYKRAQAIIAADATMPIVSAASIVAKVLRDRAMCIYADQYPMFGFDHNVGYGTDQHRNALHEFGVTQIHRRSYKPVAALL